MRQKASKNTPKQAGGIAPKNDRRRGCVAKATQRCFSNVAGSRVA